MANDPDTMVAALVTTLAAATPTAVFSVPPGAPSVRQDFSLSSLLAGDANNLATPPVWRTLNARGVLYLTNGATPGTVNIGLGQVTTLFAVPIPFTQTGNLTVEANETKMFSFEFSVSAAQVATLNQGTPGAPITVIVSASQAATAVSGLCRFWTV